MPDEETGGGLLAALKSAKPTESPVMVGMPAEPETIPTEMLESFEEFNKTENASSSRLKALKAIVKMLLDERSE